MSKKRSASQRSDVSKKVAPPADSISPIDVLAEIDRFLVDLSKTWSEALKTPESRAAQERTQKSFGSFANSMVSYFEKVSEFDSRLKGNDIVVTPFGISITAIAEPTDDLIASTNQCLTACLLLFDKLTNALSGLNNPEHLTIDADGKVLDSWWSSAGIARLRMLATALNDQIRQLENYILQLERLPGHKQFTGARTLRKESPWQFSLSAASDLLNFGMAEGCLPYLLASIRSFLAFNLSVQAEELPLSLAELLIEVDEFKSLQEPLTVLENHLVDSRQFYVSNNALLIILTNVLMARFRSMLVSPPTAPAWSRLKAILE